MKFILILLSFGILTIPTSIVIAEEETVTDPVSIIEPTPVEGEIETYQYKIIFHANGGSGTVPYILVDNDNSVKLPNSTFTRPGYKFVKWNTKADGTGTTYHYGQTVSNLLDHDGSITLYAIWGKESTITFKNGKTKVATIKAYKGIKAGNLPTLSKKGYTFMGWYTDPSGGVKISSDTYYPYDTNKTLYARFKINTYTINYNLGGGVNNSNNPTSYVYKKNKSLKKPTRNGYTFSGWYYNNKKVSRVNGNWATNITLVAKWKPIKYSISYNRNGGSGSMSMTRNVAYDSTITLRANTFTKKGSYFAGWALNPEGTGTIYTNAAQIKNLTNKRKTVKLYATWKYTPYKITYVLNGGEQNPSNPSTYNINSSIKFSRPTREGYFFQGWFTESTLENSKATIKKGSTGNITVYAKWAELNPELGDEPLRYYMVETARAEMGNVGGKKFWKWYGFNGRIPWCAIFVSWVANQNGVLDTAYPKFAGVGVGRNYFKSKNAYKKRGTYTPKPGDLIFFDWEVNNRLDHVGMVEKVEDGKVYTLEGNSKGDTARAKVYPLNSKYIDGYGIPDYNV